MIPGSANPLLLADAGYQIQRSLRLRSSASAYLARTPAVAGNRKTWTWSGWVKRGQVGSSQGIIAASGISLGIGYTTGDSSAFITVAGVGVGYTAAQFRDPSAWYHILIKFDTTQATAANRVLFYVNGINQPLNNTLVSQNGDYEINNAVVQQLGVTSVSGSATYFDGHLTEVNFIDGQALTPSSFGEISPVTGQWQAKKYAGIYGTNGFYLPFTDNSAATATAIGADKSGNGNNWTPNNISLTAGASYDSMLDVPLGAGGAERGNYAVWNPLVSIGNSLFSNGNLTATNGTSGASTCTMPVSSGKYYAEFSPSVLGNTNARLIGIYAYSAGDSLADYIAKCVAYQPEGTKRINSTSSSYGAAYTTADVIGVSVDLDNNTIEFFKNNTSQGVIDTTLSQPAGTLWTFGSSQGGAISSSVVANFGQRPFAYTPPTGFKALHTGNLPDPVIKLPAQYMAATTYTGNGTSQSVSNAVNGVGFQPDLVWTKARSSTQWHGLYNSIVGIGKYLVSNSTNAEATYADTLTAFNAGGFSLGNDSSGSGVNTSGTTYVGWQWKANGAAVANTDGSIASQVSAGVAQGFSVVTYTGTGAAATVGHGLGVAPKMVIYKSRASARNWLVNIGGVTGVAGDYLYLNQTQIKQNSANVLNSTSTLLNLGATPESNAAEAYVAYCFSEVAGYSKMGSYIGNGNSDGPMVYCGFRPRYVMGKSTSAVGEWRIFDTARDPFNAAQSELFANLSNAEATNVAYSTDILSNGFKPRNTNTGLNDAGVTYIFMAFAEAPFKNSLAR